MDHPEFYTIHQTLSYIRAVNPHGGIMEEVLGFDDKIADKHFHRHELVRNQAYELVQVVCGPIGSNGLLGRGPMPR